MIEGVYSNRISQGKLGGAGLGISHRTRSQPNKMFPNLTIRFSSLERRSSRRQFGIMLGQKVSDMFLRAKFSIQNLFSAQADPSTPLSDAIFTVLDLETTGLEPENEAITEVSAIKYKNGREIAKYTTLVHPQIPIPPFIEKLTGITNDMVAHAPDTQPVLKNLAAFVGPSPLIVGQFINIDILFIRNHLDKKDLSKLKDRFQLENAFCTKTLAQVAIPGLKNYGGSALARYFNIKNPGAHRAENDVKTSAQTFYGLLQKIQQDNPALKTVGELRQYQGPPITEHDAIPAILQQKKPDSE